MSINNILGFISIFSISVALMMALISRNHFSKYKDILIPGMLQNLIRGYIKKGGIYNTADFEAVSEEQLIKLYRFTGMVVLVLNLIFLLVMGFLRSNTVNNEVKRPLTGDPPIEVEIDTGDKGETNLRLKVYPVEYTDEEFKALTDAAMEYAAEVLPGDNESLDKVTEKLIFPDEDETGTISFKWKPDRYDIVGSSGDIYRDDLEKDETVWIGLEMTDGTHSREEYIEVNVCGKKPEEEENNPTLSKLMQIEQKFRNDSTVVLPEKIDGTSIKVVEKERSRNMLILFFIIPVMGIVLVYHRINKLKEKSDKRQNELKEQYYSFVNRLSLMLGSGAAMKDALQLAASGNNKLKEEILFCINQINSGIPEAKAYSDMAGRVSIPEYTRLMALISQNIEHGNSKVLMLMDQEVKNAMNIKREHLRRKGEIASEKLLLPTSILLMIVIGLIMIPAFRGMM